MVIALGDTIMRMDGQFTLQNTCQDRDGNLVGLPTKF